MPALVRITLFALSALFVVLWTACGGGGGSTAGAGTYGYDGRVEVPLLPLPFGLPEPGPAQWTNAFPGLLFDRPIAVVSVPGTDDLVVAEQRGRLLRFRNDPAVTSAQATTILDLEDRVLFGGEEGLLGVAFDPKFDPHSAANGWVYVCWCRDNPRRTVVSRFRCDDDQPFGHDLRGESSGATGDGSPGGGLGLLDEGSEQVLLEIPQPFANHKAGCLQFGPDGKLYVATGDGGSGNDPFENAQDLGNLLGKILRVECDGSVPADNPFALAGSSVRGEIWAYGLRNPFRMSFDPQGRLWVGDVGQNAFEEIDVVAAGQNLGWPVFEGERSNKNPLDLAVSEFTRPWWTYGRNDGVAVIGGYVYRGSRVPALVGAYVYADYGSGSVFALVHDGVQVLQNTRLGTLPSPASFGEDRDGELLVCCFDGRVRKLVAQAGGGAAGEMPTMLSATGVFASTTALAVLPGAIEYGVNSEHWADGARQRRWLLLPGAARIEAPGSTPKGYAGDGRIVLPVGTALVKHFEFEVAPQVLQRLETRLLLHQIDGWHGYTYRWNDAGTDAELVPPGGEDRLFDVAMQAGAGTRTWRYPGRGECLQCHTAAAGRVLGVTLSQLNRTFAYPLRAADQLGTWRFLGLFVDDPGEPALLPRFAALGDTSASLDERVRCYLDANCSACHRPAGTAPGTMDLRRLAGVADLQLFGLPSVVAVPGGSGTRAIAGDHGRSDAWLRVGRRDQFGMPPLASGVVDDAFVALFAQWIDAGPAGR